MSTIRPGISDEFLLGSGVEVIAEGEYSLRIPYFDWQSKPTGHNRWRLRKPSADQKYYQLPESGSHVYFSPQPLDKSEKLYGTEGECKCLSLREAGYAAIGFPGLHCYTHEDSEVPPILLPGILEAIQLCGCKTFCFIGDGDTLSNLEFYRSAGVLALSIPAEVSVELIQLPLDGPKGIDDLRANCNGEFPQRLLRLESEAFMVDREKSFLISAALCLEARGDAIHQLTPALREHHIERIVRMAALARMSKEDPLAIERFSSIAQKVAKLTKAVFEKSVEAVVRATKEKAGEQSGADGYNHKIGYYEAIRPSSTVRPLGDILAEERKIIGQYLATDPRNMLISSCWSATTFTFKSSPYLPLLVFTGAEEDCGKSTYMRVVGRMSYRSFVLVATLSIHRVVPVYQGTFLLDESKSLSDNKELVAFINAGFDNHSNHPVDSPILPRYDMESGELQEFDPRFPKMCAGIGTFLEKDTLSRSIVINMERGLPGELDRLEEYNVKIEAVTLPIYQAHLAFWTDERQQEFTSRCERVWRRFPKEFRTRNRQKFVPLLAVAELAGQELFDEMMEAAKWKLNAPDLTTPTLAHQLLCDIARLFFRQVLLHEMQIRDPATGEISAVLQQPGTKVYLFPTPALVELLLDLPEAPWKSFGRNRRTLNAHVLFDMLRAYGLEHGRLKINKKTVRGLLFLAFTERYERFCKVGDPTLETIAVELAKEVGRTQPNPPKDDPDGTDPSGGTPKPSDTPSSPNPESTTGCSDSPEPSAAQFDTSPKTAKENNCAETANQSGTSGTFVANASASDTYEVPLWCGESNKDIQGGTSQVLEPEGLTPKVPEVPLYFQKFDAHNNADRIFTGLTSSWDRPKDQLTSTAEYFCSLLPVPSCWLGIDIETTAPPKFGKANKPLKTKDALNPWLGEVRLVALNDGENLLQYDLWQEALPQSLLRALAQAGWIAHNAAFELLYLKLHFELTPATVFCTRIANAILTNGLTHHSSENDCDEIPEVNSVVMPEEPAPGKKQKKREKKKDSLNTLKRSLKDQVGIDLPKALGDSDWGAKPLSQAQLEYSLADVRYLHAFACAQMPKLRAEGLETVALLEMTLLPIVVEMKRRGFAIDREKASGRAKKYQDLSRRKKEYVLALLGPNCPELGDTRRENGLLDWLKEKTGTRLPDLKETTLLGWDHPIGEALVDYKKTAKRLSTFLSILKHSAQDGKIHATLNPMGAVTGRFSCRELNVQQMEYVEGLFRDLYIASGKDRCLVVADAKHIELRTGGICAYAVTGKSTLVDIFRQGEKADPHSSTAGSVLSVPTEQIAKSDRQKAKAINFGLLYGQSADGLRIYAKNTYGVSFTLEEAIRFRRRFFEQYEDLALWHRWAWDEIENGPPTESRTILGRRHLIPPGTSKWNMFQALVNTPATGSAADFNKWCMIELVRVLPPDCNLVMSVHDELIVDCPVSRAQEIQALMKHVMETVFARLFDNIIPGPADVSSGPNWEAAKP